MAENVFKLQVSVRGPPAKMKQFWEFLRILWRIFYLLLQKKESGLKIENTKEDGTAKKQGARAADT